MGRKEELRADLDAALAGVEETARAIAAADWSKPSPNEGWTARDVLAHLVSAENGNLSIARRVLAGEAQPVEGFDLARWNARQLEKMGPREPAAILEDLRAARAETLAFLDSVSEADLDKQGHRTTGEPTTLAGVFEQIARHQREHTADIRKAVAG